MLLEIIFVTVLLVLDQIVKYLTVTFLKGQPSIIVIDKVFQLTYVENRGAAFGMLQNQRLFFLIFTAIILILIFILYRKIPRTKHYSFLRFTTLLYIAGAIGNYIDRVRLSYVIDTFYFSLIDFPVFNMADSYVVVSAFLFGYLLLFYYKDQDLTFINFKKKK